jgi:hypothetical protein
MPYHKDPMFKSLYDVQRQCHQLAKSKKIKSYLIDAMPLDQWLVDPVPAVTNSIIIDNPDHNDLIFKIPDSFYGIYYYPYSIDNFCTNKSYNCFINRMDPIRQSWLYQLIRRNLFESGYISFNLDTSRIPWMSNMTPIQAFQSQFEKCLTIFEPEHNYIKNMLPYKNFVDNVEISNVILDSKFSIVLETYFDDNNIITYSEKTFRVLQLPRPWVLFSHRHAVKYLRRMGFDTLDDIVNHNQYDNIEFGISRQIEILNLAEELVSLDINKLKPRLIEAASYNQHLMKQFSESWQTDYRHTIDLAVEKLNEIDKN